MFVLAAAPGVAVGMDADPSYLFNSQATHMYPAKVDKVIALLKQKFNQDPVVFNYQRQIREVTQGAWGKAAVSLENTATDCLSSCPELTLTL